jgi:cardiolipin synthase
MNVPKSRRTQSPNSRRAQRADRLGAKAIAKARPKARLKGAASPKLVQRAGQWTPRAAAPRPAPVRSAARSTPGLASGREAAVERSSSLRGNDPTASLGRMAATRPRPTTRQAQRPARSAAAERAARAGGLAIAALPDEVLRSIGKEQKVELARVLIRDLQNHRPSEPYDPSEPEAMRSALSQLVLGCATSGALDYVLTRVDASALASNLGGADRKRARAHLEALHAATPGDWAGYRRYLEDVADVESSGPNHLELLIDGAEISPKGYRTLEGARDTINLSVFVLQGDDVSAKVVDLLCAKAREGVEVRVALDGGGTHVDSDPRVAEFISKLRAAGVAVVVNEPSLTRSHLDHRKILVVDGKVGFTGGSNIGDHYHTQWHDQQTVVRGPAVDRLQDAFFANWRREGGAMPPEDQLGRFYRSEGPVVSGSETYVVPHTGAHLDQNIKAAYLKALNTAERRVVLANPYLADADIIQALCNAAQRGVQVQVLIPEINDVFILRDAARGFYPDMLEAGVEVYEYQGRLAHHKVAVIDDTWATVGSSNLDARSLRNNDELNLVVLDPKFAREVQRRLFDVDLAQSRRIDAYDPGLRERLARFVSPLL